MRRLTVCLLALLACGEATPKADRGTEDATPSDPPATAEAIERPEERLDTIRIEGMPEPVRLRLFQTGDDFPLRFSAYVPADMATEADRTDSTASVHIRADFGGVRDTDAYLHLFVHPAGTGRQEALAAAHGYVASRGVPVSQGIGDPGAAGAAARMPWAIESWTFRYQSDGDSFVGSVGVGQREGRLYQLVRHYPAEYGDGFGPRAALVEATWRWGDGSPLREAEPSPGPGGGASRDG